MDSRNFLLNSDFTMPVLSWVNEGVLENIQPSSGKTNVIPHNLPFAPLLLGVWSVNSDFNPSYDISNFIGSSTDLSGVWLNNCEADTTNVTMEAWNLTDSPKNVYYKIWGIAPPDYVGELPNIYDGTNFMLSTDFNYPKIVKAGVINITEKSTATIQHGLGYIPQARVWGPSWTGAKTQAMFRYLTDTPGESYGPVINENNLLITALYTGNHYYLIFGDSA